MNEENPTQWPWVFMCVLIGFFGCVFGVHLGEYRAETDLVCNERHERWVLGLDKHGRDTAWRSMIICRGSDWEKAKTFHDYLKNVKPAP